MDHVFEKDNWSYISSRLRSRLIVFLFIAIALIAFAGYDIFIGQIRWWVALISLFVGGLIGFIYGRLVRVHWNEDEEKVATRMDAVGIVLIIFYIAFGYLREWLLGHLFSGIELTDIALALAGGLLIGRFLGMHISLMRILREHRPDAR
ncbi:MAG: hypothetical protein P4M11_05855 [Candidatus Pacebacteria bacterium]|nr:hypothetical protein [Candidatus Paceibacterota bacterium]